MTRDSREAMEEPMNVLLAWDSIFAENYAAGWVLTSLPDPGRALARRSSWNFR